MNEGRWVLLIASEVGGTDSVSDRAMERLVEAIRQEGYEVVRTSTPEDGLSLVTSDPSHSAILLDWDLEGESQFDERAALKILRAVRHRNKKIPIFLIADRTLVSELPLEVVKQVHEYIHLFGDTPAFIANRVDFAVERYHEQLLHSPRLRSHNRNFPSSTPHSSVVDQSARHWRLRPCRNYSLFDQLRRNRQQGETKMRFGKSPIKDLSRSVRGRHVLVTAAPAAWGGLPPGCSLAKARMSP